MDLVEWIIEEYNPAPTVTKVCCNFYFCNCFHMYVNLLDCMSSTLPMVHAACAPIVMQIAAA